MRKLTEKVALVALVCISLVFVVTTTLYMTNLIPQTPWAENGIGGALTIVLGVLFVALAVYLVYVNFSSGANLKRILLYCDSESATSANKKVVENIIEGCVKQVSGIKIRKTKITADEKQGFVLTLYVATDSVDVQKNLDKLRCLLISGFTDTLGLKFNSVNFVVERLAAKFSPDTARAQQMADKIAEQRQQANDFYNDPQGKCNTDCADENNEVSDSDTEETDNSTAAAEADEAQNTDNETSDESNNDKNVDEK